MRQAAAEILGDDLRMTYPSLHRFGCTLVLRDGARLWVDGDGIDIIERDVAEETITQLRYGILARLETSDTCPDSLRRAYDDLPSTGPGYDVTGI